MRMIARPIPQLTAEQVVILTLLSTATVPLTPMDIERSFGPKGQRISIASPLEGLEEHKLVEREMPAPASPKYVLTEDGETLLAKAVEGPYAKRVLSELDARVEKWAKPHARDGSCIDEDGLAPYRQLRKLLTGEAQFARGRRIDPDEDQDYADDEEAFDAIPQPRQQVRRGSLAWRQAQKRKPSKRSLPLRSQDPRTQQRPSPKSPARTAAASSSAGRAAAGPQRPKPRKVQSAPSPSQTQGE